MLLSFHLELPLVLLVSILVNCSWPPPYIWLLWITIILFGKIEMEHVGFDQ